MDFNSGAPAIAQRPEVPRATPADLCRGHRVGRPREEGLEARRRVHPTSVPGGSFCEQPRSRGPALTLTSAEAALGGKLPVAQRWVGGGVTGAGRGAVKALTYVRLFLPVN